jgi:hypothetical protein
MSSTIKILERQAQPQHGSLLLTMLPLEIRLIIYNFLFFCGTATVYIHGEWKDVATRRRHWGDWPIVVRHGQSCYHHIGGGFSLLNTCRQVFTEGFGTYWSQTALRVMDSRHLKRYGCDLHQVCRYLPAQIKRNLRHLRTIFVPIARNGRLTADEANWAPTLLATNFPQLVTCAFPVVMMACLQRAMLPLATPNSRRVTGGGLPGVSDDDADDAVDAERYFDVGRFRLGTGESPAAFLERMTGLKKSCGIMFLGEGQHCFNYDSLRRDLPYRSDYVSFFFELFLYEKKLSGWERC